MSEPADRTVQLLNAVLQWELARSQWQQVDELLAKVRGALLTEDYPEARRGISLLMLCGPRRVGRSVNPQMGAVERSGVSGATRELINELVHILVPDDAPRDDQDAADPDGDEPHDSDRR